MASISLELQPGITSMYEDDIVVGTAAPTTAGTVQLRVDLVNTPNREQVIKVVKAFLRRLEGERFNDLLHV